METQGIYCLKPLKGSGEWYWGMDHTGGDLYEAEELFSDDHPVCQNRLIFVHYPDGEDVQPVTAKQGQYLGRPVYYNGKIVLLLADFPQKKIKILLYDAKPEELTVLTELPRSVVKDCCNLMLEISPLMLTRRGNDGKFQILWPEHMEFEIGDRESFLCRMGERLYFSNWYEEPECQEEIEEIIVRRLNTGELIKKIPGCFMDMPDGQIWVLE